MIAGISDFDLPPGMMARNSLGGPGAWNLDMALQKDFKLTERYGLQFRAEGFDIFNDQPDRYFSPRQGDGMSKSARKRPHSRAAEHFMDV